MGDNRTYGSGSNGERRSSRSRSHSSATGPGRCSRSSPVPRWRWAWGSMRHSTCRPRSRGSGWGRATPRAGPPKAWCVKNGSGYRSPMSMSEALALSPNTALAKLIQQVGVGRTVDMAVRLGLRSYAEPGTARDYVPKSDESLADYVKRANIGSFTLGPFEVNPVGATMSPLPSRPVGCGVRPARSRRCSRPPR